MKIKAILLSIIVTLGFNHVQAQVFEMGKEEGNVRDFEKNKNIIDDLVIDYEEIKRVKSNAVTIVEEMKPLKKEEIKKEDYNIEKVVVSINKSLNQENIECLNIDIKNLKNMNEINKDMIKNYILAYCERKKEVEEYQKKYLEINEKNENKLNYFLNYKSSYFNAIEQKLVHLKIYSLMDESTYIDVSNIYNGILQEYLDFNVKESMIKYVINEEIKKQNKIKGRNKEKDTLLNIVNLINNEIKERDLNNILNRNIFYFNYVLEEESRFKESKIQDKKFIPKILIEKNNEFYDKTVTKKECNYLHYAVPNINLNNLKIKCEN